MQLSLDISAVFDTLDHCQLLSRVHQLFGFSNNVLKWLQSYIFWSANTASLWVNAAHELSKVALASPGLGVGHISLFHVLDSCRQPDRQIWCHHQYANDTQLYKTTNLRSSNHLVSLSLRQCSDQLARGERLFLNSSKTEAIITGTRQCIAKFDQSSGIVVAGSNMPFIDKLHVLVMTLDSQLPFDDNVSEVVQKQKVTVKKWLYVEALFVADLSSLTIFSQIVNVLYLNFQGQALTSLLL